jgi:hypothetical protein
MELLCSRAKLVDYEVFTASNSTYFHFLLILIKSIGFLDPKIKINVINCGLTEGQINELSLMCCTVHESRNNTFIKVTEDKRPFTERPFLPLYCKNPTAIIWIDADCYVQSLEFFNTMQKVFARGMFGASYESSPAYLKSPNFPRSKNWMANLAAKHYNDSIGRAIFERATINSGVFAAKSEDTIWESWQNHLNYLLTKTGYFFGIDQLALNAAVLHLNERFFPLSAKMNWMANMSIPRIEEDIYLEPYTEELLFVVHFAENSKKLYLVAESVLDKREANNG